MVKKDDIDCPVKYGLQLFEGKWNPRVIYELILCPTMRFGQLRKAIPSISNTMLSSTLKDLEEKGLVKRKQFNVIPPHVEYSLTEGGKAFSTILDAIGEWSTKYYKNK